MLLDKLLLSLPTQSMDKITSIKQLISFELNDLHNFVPLWLVQLCLLLNACFNI